jgi:hypothetical protein
VVPVQLLVPMPVPVLVPPPTLLLLVVWTQVLQHLAPY